MLIGHPFMQLLALAAAIPTGAGIPSLSVHSATTLASAIYDLPNASDMPGDAEQKRQISQASGKLKSLNPGRDREIDEYSAELMAGPRVGCIAGVRTEIAKRLKANFGKRELNSLTAFSDTAAGSLFFIMLRETAYGSGKTNAIISDSADMNHLVDNQTRLHFADFYNALMANENHWIRVSCELGGANTAVELASKLQALNLKNADDTLMATNTRKTGFKETDDPNYKKAVELISMNKLSSAENILLELSAKNNISAKVLLAKLYYQRESVSKNLKTAFSLFKEAALAHDVEGEYYLAMMYSRGEGISRDPSTAFEWTYKSAEGGYPPAELALADSYKMGDGIQKDNEKALLWYRRSAEDEYAPAEYKLGVLYRQGTLVVKDYRIAAQWLDRAAQKDYAQAESALGSMYESGQGVLQDYSRSFKLFQQAAKLGYAGGQYGLGVAYFFGHGTPRDSTAAVGWYLKAATQGYAAAQFTLGVCFANGDGMAKDMIRAVKWYLEAANQGNGGAQFNLGFAYGLGQGVPVSPIDAYKWFALSSSSPETEKLEAARSNRDHAAAQITSAQLETAKALVAAWRPDNTRNVQAIIGR